MEVFWPRAKSQKLTANSAFPVDHNLRIYAWFLLLVTVLPAAARLLRPRELAKILLLRYKDPGRRKRARFGGYFFLAVSLGAMPFAIRLRGPKRPGLSSRCW